MAVINCIKEYDIIFIHIPKNGGSSIRRGYFNNNFEKYIGDTFPEKWENKFKFTFVRNPFDRFISAYKMFTTGFIKNEKSMSWNNYKTITTHKFLEIVKKDKDYFNTSGIGFHTYPQTHKLNYLHKADFIGRFETLDEDFKKICEINKIKYTKLPHWNKTNRLDYREYYDDKLFENVSDYYSEDLKILNYKF